MNEKILTELEEVAHQAGDALDREGCYISDKIRNIIMIIKEVMEGKP